jgi:hypothetical protein
LTSAAGVGEKREKLREEETQREREEKDYFSEGVEAAENRDRRNQYGKSS